jgi:hypothetical protein
MSSSIKAQQVTGAGTAEHARSFCGAPCQLLAESTLALAADLS